MKVVSLDSADKNDELSLNYSSSKSDEFSKKEKIKEIYFIILYEKRTMEKPNDFIFTKNEYQAKNICTKMINKKPDLYIRPETNRQSAVQNVDYSQIITQIRGYGQGEGENQLKTDIIKADNAHISKYGAREKIIVDRRFTNKETLTAYCRSILKQYQDPIISYDITII